MKENVSGCFFLNTVYSAAISRSMVHRRFPGLSVDKLGPCDIGHSRPCRRSMTQDLQRSLNLLRPHPPRYAAFLPRDAL